jgi:glucose-induced degradation protein 8
MSALVRFPTTMADKFFNDSDLNAVIMDYFISEGYPDAARMLAKEANIKPQLDHELIEERRAIKNDILKGDIQSSIERLNDLNPQVCIPGP